MIAKLRDRITLGKVYEQIIPLLLYVKYNIDPRDLRFLGSPIDYIVFKGLSNGNLEEIIFLEVKLSNRSRLTKNEQLIRRLVEDKKVRWLTISIEELLKQLY